MSPAQPAPKPEPQPAAQVIAELLRAHTGLELPVRLRAWDGSEAGPAGPPVLILRSSEALRRVLWRPGELGLARAYISGDLDVEGDLTEAFRQVWATLTGQRPQAATPAPTRLPTRWIRQPITSGRGGSPNPSRAAVLAASTLAARPALATAAATVRKAAVWTPAALAAVRAAAQLDVLKPVWPPPQPPGCELRVTGRLHSRARDLAVVAGHYDLPAAFYQLILDPSMAYSAACWTAGASAQTLADAQRAKLKLICHKLALRPGQQLLDVGCGWGSLSIHAARDYRVQVTAVTLSTEQGGYIRQRAKGLGLRDRVDVRVQDYRDPAGESYDAIASVEMGEHVGAAGYPRFCADLYQRLRPGGRLLIQQMSRGSSAPGGGPFIESYIAPDMHMRPVGETVQLIEDAGFEVIGVEAMRADYVRTIRAWLENFERNLPEIANILTAEQIRVWRLYLVGGALAFEQGRMGVDQILAVKPDSAPAVRASRRSR